MSLWSLTDVKSHNIVIPLGFCVQVVTTLKELAALTT